MYGENGSGKSSLYYALKEFFQSSVESIGLAGVEDIFVTDDQRGTGAIRVTFKPDRDGADNVQTNELTVTGKDTDAEIDLRDANGLKSFLTYKHLLDIHHIKKGGQINLFNLLVKGVLKHFKNSLTNGHELGELGARLRKQYFGKLTELIIRLRREKTYPKNSEFLMMRLVSYSTRQPILNPILITFWLTRDLCSTCLATASV